MDYNKVIKQILYDYKKTFGIDCNIIYGSKEELLKKEPTLIMNETTAGVYHNKIKLFLSKVK